MGSKLHKFSFRHLMREFARQLKMPWIKFLITITSKLFALLSPNIFITYDHSAKPDGVGAQIQRVLGIYSLAIRFNLKLVECSITNVAIHPLDGIETEDDYRKYIDRINKNFTIPQALPFPQNAIVTRVRKIDFHTLWFAFLKTFFSSDPHVLMILEPYAFSEIFIQDIVKAAKQTPFFSKVEQIRHQRRIENSQEKLLAIHYRHGVGELSVQIGETLSRELPRVYFSNLLELIEKNYGLSDTRIVVFTDAPVLALDFVPPKEQGHLWVTSPKYLDGVLEISGVPDEDFALDLLAEVEVNRGGDPLNAILMLASADILCMSRSSFSYIAAIYNPDGVIFMPADFWHQPLPNWIKI